MYLSPVNGRFSRSTWVSRYQNVSILDLLELRMIVVVTNGDIKRAKLQSNCHHQHTNTEGPSCRSTNSVKALKGLHANVYAGE